MSQEHYPPTDRAKAGSTPAHAPGGQRALVDDEDAHTSEVPPQDTVPDELAEEDVERLRAGKGAPGPDVSSQVDPGGDDPMHATPSTSEARGRGDRS